MQDPQQKLPILSHSEDNSCDKKPLLNIELNHVVVDELHLMLRITGILTENIITECLNWDQDNDLNQKRRVPTSSLEEINPSN